MKKLSFYYVLVHVLFWCTYTISWSYTAVYLKSCGYNNEIVGFVTGIGAVVSVLLQPILASATARSRWLNNKSNIILLKCISLVVVVLMAGRVPGIYTAAVLFTILVAIDASIPSILSCAAMDCINAGKNLNYGMARGTGSIAFALFSALLGYLVNDFGEECLIFLYGIISVGMILVVVLFQACDKREGTSGLPDRETGAVSETAGNHMLKSLAELWRKYRYLKYFLLSAVFLFMSHNMLNVFLLMIIERVGGNSEQLGIALAIAAAVELPVMTYFVKLSGKISTDKLLVISAFFFTVKSLLTLFAGNMAMVFLAQFFQFGAFALFTPASVYFINKTMDTKDCGVGQALLGACSLGLGGTFGNVLGGILLEKFGPDSMILGASALAGVGFCFMLMSRRAHLGQAENSIGDV